VAFLEDGQLGSDSALTTPNVIGDNEIGVLVEASGNTLAGVRIFGNLIGTDSDESNLGNGTGILVLSGGIVRIGQPGAGNIIGNSSGSGIEITETVNAGSESPDYWIRSNRIGINPQGGPPVPLPNATGIRIGSAGNDSSGVRIGASVSFPPDLVPPSPAVGNTIAYNAGDGIDLSPAGGLAVQVNNSARGNVFAFNGGQPINLGPDGDENDADGSSVGPNNLQNFPVFDPDETYLDVGAEVIKFGYSIPIQSSNADYPLIVDFHASDYPDGDGLISYLGSHVYEQGDAKTLVTGEIDFQSIGNVAGFLMIATATDSAGNTSQFSDNGVLIQTPDDLFQDRFEQ